MSLFTNPEIIRNARIQLRPRRMLIVAGISASLSATLIYLYLFGHVDLYVQDRFVAGGESLLHTILWIQALVLVVGGGIASIHAIQREKDQNTFDFQRLTRLSPLELTIGKLFGPPLMVFFVFLCFIPAAIVGAIYARTPATILLGAYVLLILGAIVYMAFALVISLYLQRGTATWAILFYLLLVLFTAIPNSSVYLGLGPLVPFFALDVARQATWSVGLGTRALPGVLRQPNFPDYFFGIPVHHALVLFILYLTLLAWFIPAVARNIKRDPSNYELYTPGLALGFLCYLNFIIFAFFSWGSHGGALIPSALPGMFIKQLPPPAPFDTQSTLLALNIGLFFIFGFVLLRNRNRMRRRLHSAEAGPIAPESIWPAPYIFLGAILVGAAMILVIQWKRDPSLEWSLAVAIFRVIFFAVWLSRDLLFLQWMNLRRGRHPLPLGVLYLIAFYVCAGIIVAPLHLMQNPFTAIFLPTPLFVLNTALWTTHAAEWIVALMGQAAIALIFVFLQRQQIEELQPHPVESRANASASAA